MLSFLQPILSCSQGGGEGTFISVPHRAFAALGKPALTGAGIARGQGTTCTWQQTQPVTCPQEPQHPLAPPKHRMSPTQQLGARHMCAQGASPRFPGRVWSCAHPPAKRPSPSGLFSREQSFITVGTEGDRAKSTRRVPSKQLLCGASNTGTHTRSKTWEKLGMQDSLALGVCG